MSSIHSAPSQIPARSRYIAGASAHIYDANGQNASSVAQYAVLEDMGTTVQLPNATNTSSQAVLRKVRVLPLASTPVTGYIYIDGPSLVPAGQNITRLN